MISNYITKRDIDFPGVDWYNLVEVKNILYYSGPMKIGTMDIVPVYWLKDGRRAYVIGEPMNHTASGDLTYRVWCLRDVEPKRKPDAAFELLVICDRDINQLVDKEGITLEPEIETVNHFSHYRRGITALDYEFLTTNMVYSKAEAMIGLINSIYFANGDLSYPTMLVEDYRRRKV